MPIRRAIIRFASHFITIHAKLFHRTAMEFARVETTTM